MLLEDIDRFRLEISPTLDKRRRSKLGQFMTPVRIAAQMACLFENLPDQVRLLDAGAGMGALTAAFVRYACGRSIKPKSIHVVAYEVDSQMADILQETLSRCVSDAEIAGIKMKWEIIRDDFILHSAEPLLKMTKTFNCAIMNPPYGKINVASKWRAALRSRRIETVNLYTAFVAVALQQLEDRGELVAITPRSFCNGSYYESFRRQMLSSCALRDLHVFESRKTAFKDDDVLQENIIFRVVKGGVQNGVNLSTDAMGGREVPFSEIVRPNDSHAFIRIPVSEGDLAERVQALPCRLEDLGIKVSTGRVVDFRAKEHLRKEPSNTTVPLIYPTHFEDGGIRWPIPNFKKHNAIEDCADTASLMIPGGIYVLTKRFSAKEEKRRLVAAIYDGGRVGFENHLNYFHDNGRGLPLDLARGLSAFLNSEAVDQYFRIFSGHTQVNATDLRSLHYPTRSQLEEIGRSDNNREAAVNALI